MFKQFVLRHIKLICTLLVIILYALVPLFIHSPYYIDLFIIILVHAALAMTFVLLLRCGMINLGIAAFWGIGAYVSTVLVMKLGVPFWASLPLTTIITGIVALGIGYILLGGGGSGFGFVMLSAVIGSLFSTVVGNIPYVGGYLGIRNVPPPETISLPFLPDIVFGINNKTPFFYLSLILFLIIILIIRAFYASRVGRAWTAIGLDSRLAESMGINVYRYKMLAFVVASAIAGLVGSFFAHYEGFVIPTTFGMWVNIYLQIYAILGGIGYAIIGPIVGSSIMTAIPELTRMATVIAPIVTGGLLIILILFLPNGLMGLLQWREQIFGFAARVGKTIKSPFSSKQGAGKS